MNELLQNTNWAKTDEENIYDIYDEINLPADKAEMLLYLIKHKPKLELDFIEMFSEIDNDFLFEHKSDTLEQIVDAYAQHLPNEFINDFEYLLKDLLNYYFFTNNIKGIEKHLGFIKKHPAKGVDLITIPLLWQFTYFGYYTHALELSKSVWEPLLIDEQIWGNAHAPFCTTIYLHELEQAYYKLLNNENVSYAEFYNNLNKTFEVDETEKGKQTIFYCLQNLFSKTEIDTHLQNKEYRQANLKMNIWFLVYMKQKFDVPFMLSDRWWNLISATKLFGHDKNNYWYVPYNVLDEHFFKHTDNMMGVNQLEIFGKVHALEYAYHFINQYGLISEESYKLMSENITALKYVYEEYSAADLWQMTFVFKWPQLYAPDPSMEKIYRDTFCKDQSEMIAFENNQQLIFNLMRPELQDQVKEKNRELFDDFYNVDEDDDYEFEDSPFNDEYYYPNETIVREDPKIGRNDPCPCGSGKKYKKCCLNKN